MITMYFGVWTIWTGKAYNIHDGKTEGIHTARGSSCRASPVRFSYSNASPPGLTCPILSALKIPWPRGPFGLTVVGDDQTPEKSGLPSGMREISWPLDAVAIAKHIAAARIA